MKIKNIQRGFTLTEILVVIGVIVILALILLPQLSDTRLRAKDASVAVALSSFRTNAELEFGGEFADLCDSDLYTSLVERIEGLGGEVNECITSDFDFRIVAILPTTVAGFAAADGLQITKTAHAQQQSTVTLPGGSKGDAQSIDLEVFEKMKALSGYCVNSRGVGSMVELMDVPGSSAFARALSQTKATTEAAPATPRGSKVIPDVGDGLTFGLVKTAHAQQQSTVALPGGSRGGSVVTQLGGGGTESQEFYCTLEEKARDLNVDIVELRGAQYSFYTSIVAGEGALPVEILRP